ncbi:ABC transporter ATP-binding protein [Gordonia sp. SID5947]|uniref:energy-coupling factor ABC transporter ATP-binding protein n=1 Tax=Gordonia sp. SID5947 TaxID=2690315 RepID=UPI0031BA7BAE
MTRGDDRSQVAAEVTASDAIVIENLGFAYPDGRVALRDVTLRVAAGERIGLLGPNGAGKTTLMLHLNGVLRATSGQVAINGRTITSATVRDVRREVGLVFQDPDDQLFMPTLAEDVAFGPANFGVTEPQLAERVSTALAEVGMTDRAARGPSQLSGGERRRGALATVLACDPDILVLDEPSANLDPVARRELVETLQQLTTTMVIVTHDLPYAAQLCDRVVIMDAGAIVADGPTGQLLSDDVLLARHRLELPWGFRLP